MKLRSGTEGVETTDDTGNYEEKSTDTLENQPLLCFECNNDLSYDRQASDVMMNHANDCFIPHVLLKGMLGH